MVYADRVKQSTATIGTGTYTLSGSDTGFQTFSSALTDGDTVQYCTNLANDWEVGTGVFTAAGTTLTRASILASSNAGAAVNWGAGSKEIFITIPAQRINFSGSLVYISGADGNQAINSGSDTIVNFPSEDYDTDAFHDNSVNNSRLTIPSNVSRVRLSGGVNWSHVSSSGRRIQQFWKNGSEFIGSARSGYDPNSISGNMTSSSSPVINVSSGDYFQLIVFQDSGGTQDIVGDNLAKVWLSLEVIE